MSVLSYCIPFEVVHLNGMDSMISSSHFKVCAFFNDRRYTRDGIKSSRGPAASCYMAIMLQPTIIPDYFAKEEEDCAIVTANPIMYSF